MASKRMSWRRRRAIKGFLIPLAAAHLAACGDSETADDANRYPIKHDNSTALTISPSTAPPLRWIPETMPTR